MVEKKHGVMLPLITTLCSPFSPQFLPSRSARIHRMRMRKAVLTLFGLCTSISQALNPPPNITECNGSAAICSRKYSNVSLIGTHGSAHIGGIHDWRINQERSVTFQLDSGIRFLQAQTHQHLGKLRMCHTSCWLYDGGTLDDYLTTVKNWLDAHPNEVVTMLITNYDRNPPGDFNTVFSSVGLDKLAFVPASSPEPLSFDAWPTYAELIALDSRLVLFLDYEADTSMVPYILPEFDYFFETPFNTVDPKFDHCTLDRGPDGSEGGGLMYIVNHFLDIEVGEDVLNIPDDLLDVVVPDESKRLLIPDHDSNFATNAATGDGSIGAQAELCKTVWGRWPNVVLVDMFSRGNVFEAQNRLNGLRSTVVSEVE